jgi:hypothetical protein
MYLYLDTTLCITNALGIAMLEVTIIDNGVSYCDENKSPCREHSRVKQSYTEKTISAKSIERDQQDRRIAPRAFAG